MATSAFKSTTKRNSLGTPSNTDDTASSTEARRRSSSLSRFPRWSPEFTPDGEGEIPTPRGRFVNTIRGSGFPEISLDDLAIEFFPIKDSVGERESTRSRSSRRSSNISPSTASSQRRGRSVSRKSSRGGDEKGNFYNGLSGDSKQRRMRSVSVVRGRLSDTERDLDRSQNSSEHNKLRGFGNGNNHMASTKKATASSQRRLGRSASQKDLFTSHDSYSSQSSGLTDDELRDARYGKNDAEKTIRAVYAQKKTDNPTNDDVNPGLYEVMRKELRYAVEEIRTEIEHVMTRKPSALTSNNHLKSNKCDVSHATSPSRKKHATKSEPGKLVQMAMKEQRGEKQSGIERELIPDSKGSAISKGSSQSRKSSDRSRVSKRLNEEAERYFEDFISNVEDTDFSSFDGERSDESSTLGKTVNQRDRILHGGEEETYQSPSVCKSLPFDMDGVNLPWLKWETSHDGFPVSSKNKYQLPVTPKTLMWDAARDVKMVQDWSSNSTSSWSPELAGACTMNKEENSECKSRESRNQSSRFDMDKYSKLKLGEELLFEIWEERSQISSGGLLLCNNVLQAI